MAEHIFVRFPDLFYLCMCEMQTDFLSGNDNTCCSQLGTKDTETSRGIWSTLNITLNTF